MFIWQRFEQTLDELRSEKQFRFLGTAFDSGQTGCTRLTAATKKMLKEIGIDDHMRLQVKSEYSLLWLEGKLTFPGSKKMPITHFPKPEIGPPHTTYFSELAAWQFWNYNIPDDLRLALQTFLMSICIASAGAVMPGAPRWVINSHKLDYEHGMINPIIAGIDFLSEHGVTFEKSLPVDTVHKWISSKNGIFDGYSDSPSSRAVNLITRLFRKSHPDDELSNLIWALAGIEALLVEGGRSSSGQLREKLLALLGSQVDRKWLVENVKRSYDFRSRMLHGNRPVRSHFRQDEEDSDSRFEEEYDSEKFAVGLLVYLIHFMINKQVDCFEFETRLKI